MGETFARVNLYAEQHHEIPSSLAVLLKREGYANQMADGWGRPLQYSVGDDGRLKLTSLGRDGTPGGTEEDADISKPYLGERSDGSLWVGSEMWIIEAEGHG